MNILFRYHLPLIVYAAAIFVLSSIAEIQVPNVGFEWSDKIAHLVEFFVFGWLAVRAFAEPPISLRGKMICMAAILLGVLYGASDEFHQSFVPGRSADPWDWLADSVGTTLGALAHRRKIHWTNS